MPSTIRCWSALPWSAADKPASALRRAPKMHTRNAKQRSVHGLPRVHFGSQTTSWRVYFSNRFPLSTIPRVCPAWVPHTQDRIARIAETAGGLLRVASRKKTGALRGLRNRRGRQFAAGNHAVDNAVIDRLLRAHDVIAIHVARHALERLAARIRRESCSGSRACAEFPWRRYRYRPPARPDPAWRAGGS